MIVGHRTARDVRGRDDLQFRLICALSFPAFVIAVALRRFKPNLRRSSRLSLFAEAWEASATTARLAFAG